MIHLLHTETTSTVKADQFQSEEFRIGTGVHQGCVLAPSLFDAAVDYLMKNVESRFQGFRMDGMDITDLDFADDIALFANSEAEIQGGLEIFVEEAEKLGLEMNWSKTELLRTNYLPEPDVMIRGTEIGSTSAFKYLSSLITADSSCESEIKRRIANCSTKMAMLYKPLRS